MKFVVKEFCVLNLVRVGFKNKIYYLCYKLLNFRNEYPAPETEFSRNDKPKIHCHFRHHSKVSHRPNRAANRTNTNRVVYVSINAYNRRSSRCFDFITVRAPHACYTSRTFSKDFVWRQRALCPLLRCHGDGRENQGTEASNAT